MNSLKPKCIRVTLAEAPGFPMDNVTLLIRGGGGGGNFTSSSLESPAEIQKKKMGQLTLFNINHYMNACTRISPVYRSLFSLDPFELLPANRLDPPPSSCRSDRFSRPRDLELLCCE